MSMVFLRVDEWSFLVFITPPLKGSREIISCFQATSSDGDYVCRKVVKCFFCLLQKESIFSWEKKYIAYITVSWLILNKKKPTGKIINLYDYYITLYIWCNIPVLISAIPVRTTLQQTRSENSLPFNSFHSILAERQFIIFI